ncbi:Protein PELOTA 1 [Vigna angularis]|uniref:Protein PELOTA 1 n=1 Tax=Phaseolus angularis TaxID=3914 RepID=A0A8T0JVT1_PHAAN|nr:Protein PELOTA 1 [Vigna angularis]
MRIVRRDIVPNGPGSVKMVAVDSDDLWFAYNLIAPGDSVMAVTVRKVVREAAHGGRDAERVKLKLEIKVEEVADYDKEGSILRVRGKNILENEHVKVVNCDCHPDFFSKLLLPNLSFHLCNSLQIGAFHTLELELQRPFVVRKDVWDSLALEVLQQASDPGASADLAVVLMQEGLAHILLALDKFFENVMQAFLKHIDFNVVRCAVIASPGFTKDQFHRHLFLEAERRQLRAIIENKSRIILVHTTSGYKNSDISTRQKFVNLVNSVKDSGGSVHVFSSMHVSGEQLAQISGIAAILRFPLPDLEDIEM